MHRTLAAAIVAALALALASCGGSETTLDRAELIRRVELACRAAAHATQQQSRAETKSASSNPYAALRSGQKLLLARLETLEGSDDTKDDFNAYKEGVRTRLVALEKVASAPRAEQARVLRAVEREAAGMSRKIAAALGRLRLRGCG